VSGLKKKVLVIGGSGFIGSFIVAKLKELPFIIVNVLGQHDLDGIRLGQIKPLFQLLENNDSYDVVINMAAYIGDDSKKIIKSNYHGIHDILDCCNHFQVGLLIHLSRSFEVKNLELNTSSRLKNLYEYSKQYAELLLENRSKVPTKILRITAPVWTNMPMSRYLSQILFNIAKDQPVKIFGRGKRIQNYVRLDSISDAVIALMDSSLIKSCQYYMACGPENFSDYKFAEIVHERLGLPFNYEFVSYKGISKMDESDYGIKNPSDFSSELGIKLRHIDSDYLSSQMSVIRENSQSGVVL